LEYFDLTENLIVNIEVGAFKQLGKLRTLLIGEHNFANATLLEEISQIESLEVGVINILMPICEFRR
jgi:hypothetical protein